MQTINNYTFTGRLTKDPELRQAGERMVCELRVAIGRRRGREGEDRGAVFIDALAWEHLGEVVAEHLSKGARVAGVGRIEYEEWETKDGSPRSKHHIVLDQLQFLDPRPGADQHEPVAAVGTDAL